jgi:predicted dehydrogenase
VWKIYTSVMTEIRWGIIGCGDVTEKKSGPAFNKVNNSKLVAVMRRNAAKAEDYAARHNVPKWYSDAQQLIDDPEINAVYIATPPSSHAAYALAAIKANKHVYVEKPMALSAAECIEMVDAANQQNVKLTVAHYRRQVPLFKRVKELIVEGDIGEVRFANLKMWQPIKPSLVAKTEENWRTNPAISGGGLFHDLAPHQIDLMLYYFGNAKTFSGLSFNQANTSAADDIVSGQILFDNGIIFNGLWCFNVPAEHAIDQCTIVGTKGKIEFAVFGNYISITKNNATEEMAFEMPEHIQQPMIEQVVQYFIGNTDNPCWGETGIQVMTIIDSFCKQ